MHAMSGYDFKHALFVYIDNTFCNMRNFLLYVHTWCNVYGITLYQELMSAAIKISLS